MTGKSQMKRKVRVHEPQKPPLPRPMPPGVETKRTVPHDVELQAQRLIRKVGSADAAKQVIDAVSEQEASSDFLEDTFAVRWGFASRKELLSASKPLFNDETSNWWITQLPTGRWIVWSRDDFSTRTTFATMRDAEAAVTQPRGEQPKRSTLDDGETPPEVALE